MNLSSSLIPSLLIFAVLGFYSCTKTCPEDEVAPQPYTFEIIDSTSNENYLTKNNITENDISIRDNGSSTVDLDFHLYNDFLKINELRETGIIDCTISIADSFEFKFYVEEEQFYIDKCTDRMERIDVKIEDAYYTTGSDRYNYFKVYLN